jgi:hypothetical protein
MQEMCGRQINAEVIDFREKKSNLTTDIITNYKTLQEQNAKRQREAWKKAVSSESFMKLEKDLMNTISNKLS